MRGTSTRLTLLGACESGTTMRPAVPNTVELLQAPSSRENIAVAVLPPGNLRCEAVTRRLPRSTLLPCDGKAHMAECTAE